MKNITGSKLQKCGTKPLTGYYRNGYCDTGSDDLGSHTVCARVNRDFLEFTKSRQNNLDGVVKPGQKWCLCQDRWLEAYRHGHQPEVIPKATNFHTKKQIKKLIMSQHQQSPPASRKKASRKASLKKQYFFYDPKNPDNGYDVYVDKNPMDTINIKYTTLDDVKHTIKHLEKLYKTNRYTHKRIWQVAMIMKVRLGVIKKYAKTRYPNAKNVTSRYNLSLKYYNFLKQRTGIPNLKDRKKLTFSFTD